MPALKVKSEIEPAVLPTLADLGRPQTFPFKQRTTPEGYPPLYVKVLKEEPAVIKPFSAIVRQYLEGYHSHLGREHHGWSRDIETLAYLRLDYERTEDGLFLVMGNKRVRDVRELGQEFTKEEIEQIFPKPTAPKFSVHIEYLPYGPKTVAVRIA